MSDYQTYRLVLKPKSGLSTPLQADTIWGHLASYLAISGHEYLKDFLQSYKDGTPAVIFSDGLPALADEDGVFEQFYPKPLYPTSAELLDKLKDMNRDKLKKIKKTNWIKEDDYISLCKGDFSGLSFLKDDDKEPFKILTETTMKNAVPRWGNEDTEIYPLEETYLQPVGVELKSNEFLGWTIFFKVRADFENQLKQPLGNFLKHGYGKKKGVGKGQFEITLLPLQEDLIPEVKDANAFMSLSTYVPDADDPIDGYWQTFTKYGKLGEAGVANLPSNDPSAERNLFKSPITMLTPGAVFKLNEKMKDYYGVADLNTDQRVRNEREYTHPALAYVIGYKVFE
ncbi:MAG: hypothetical protein PHV30_06920 [Candidatus Margulisbacteria bacterium]|nr:hypothetical protein [Candidatus Margulisiibacteriota bacterium]